MDREPEFVDDSETFTAEQVESILHVTSYHRRQFEYRVIHFNPEQHDGIRTSIFKPFTSISSCSSPLWKLPIELWSSILPLLDISSVLQFSHVSLRARELVTGMKECRDLGEHAIECLCAIFRCSIASRIGIAQLYNALITENCAVCNKFGGFVYLPTVTRCCFLCLGGTSRSRTVSLIKLSRAMGISVPQLRAGMPVVHSIPGVYGRHEELLRLREQLVSEEHALAALREAGIKMAHFDLKTSPGHTAGSHMCSSSLPYLNLLSGDVETGLFCRGCQNAVESGRDFAQRMTLMRSRDWAYSKAGFIEHFRQCNKARELWASS
ncbi:hypothetical protein FZEAL_2723 [Fusarium zealandicum]|uniref:F-box domain-containing protein n=1 Tax=Fusarium zealandicum TaxID=1053134 RepID=A0A8H4UQZ7_9HYPO|nr:hypothetical protein FZEAL_2723 [Fusarium zealandicum]